MAVAIFELTLPEGLTGGAGAALACAVQARATSRAETGQRANFDERQRMTSAGPNDQAFPCTERVGRLLVCPPTSLTDFTPCQGRVGCCLGRWTYPELSAAVDTIIEYRVDEGAEAKS